MMPQRKKDLVILTADKNAEFAMRGLVSRTQSLGIRDLHSDFFVHPEKDPGCLLRSHDFLRPFTETHHHAIVVLDREGSGQEEESRINLEIQIETRLVEAGWRGRAIAVVIDPELDVWIWSDSTAVDEELNWRGRVPDLRTWLRQKQFLEGNEVKPRRPKEALEAAVMQVHKPRSSAIYQNLAQRVGLTRCVDPAFAKLRSTLRTWFPR